MIPYIKEIPQICPHQKKKNKKLLELINSTKLKGTRSIYTDQCASSLKM